MENSQPPQKPSSLLENIVSRKTDRSLPSLILGPKPGRSAPDIIQFGVENKLKAARALFQIVLVLSLLSFAFFRIELDANFHLLEKYLAFPTLANTLTNLSETIQDAQTDINFANTALTKFYLDSFVYLYNYRGMAEAKAEDLLELQKSLAILQAKVRSPLYASEISLMYERLPLPLASDGTQPLLETYLADTHTTALVTFINQQQNSLRQEIPAEDSEALYPEIQILDSLPILVEKKSSLDTLLADYEPDTLTIADVKELVKAFNDISKNDYAVISTIKDKRIDLTRNLTNIANITKKVDFYFGEPGVADLAKVFYKSYTLNADQNLIKVVGEIRTDNVMVFSELIELIEAFESAPEFTLTNEIRNFSKSEQEDKYVSQFAFDLLINPL